MKPSVTMLERPSPRQMLAESLCAQNRPLLALCFPGRERSRTSVRSKLRNASLRTLKRDVSDAHPMEIIGNIYFSYGS